MLISVTSLGSSQIFFFPHFSTAAAKRFCSLSPAPIPPPRPRDLSET